MLGPVREGDQLPGRRRGEAGAAQPDAARHRGRPWGRGGDCRNRVGGHFALPLANHGAFGDRVRPVAAGKRNSTAKILGCGVFTTEEARRDSQSCRRQERRLLGDEAGRQRGRHRQRRRRRLGGRSRRRRQGYRAVEWHGDLRWQGYRLPVMEIRLAGTRFRVSPVPYLRRRAHRLDQRRRRQRSRRAAIWKRHRCVQRDRHTPGLFAECSGGGLARAGIRGTGGAFGAFFLRNRGADASVRGGNGVRALGRRGSEALRRGQWTQGPGREGRRSARPDGTCGARGSGPAACRSARIRTREHRARHRHRRPAVFSAEVYAHRDHRVRF